MLKKKILASAVTAALATGLFVSGSAQAVQINPDNYGQVLLGPIYNVLDGFSNHVRIVNTDLQNAVKAKLILRSAIDSRECRDLILYLTPGDVAELFINPNSSNRFRAMLSSADDSLLSGMSGQGQPTFASQVPFDIDTSTLDFIRPEANGFNSVGLPNGDHCAVGHIEVVGAYAVRGVVNTPAGMVTVSQGMSKGDLFKIFSTDRQTLNSMNLNNPPESVLLPTLGNIDRIALMGSNDILVNAANGDRIVVPMTPLISSDDASLVNAGPAYLIGHNGFDVTLSAQTLIGDGWGAASTENLPDIEAPLNARQLDAIYDNIPGRRGTNVIVTFPTKYRHLLTRTPIDYSRGFIAPSPFYPNGSVEYAVASFDMMENIATTVGCWVSPCGGVATQYITDETNYINSAYFQNFFNAEKGWFSLQFNNPNPPVPALGHTHRMTNQNSVVDVMARKH